MSNFKTSKKGIELIKHWEGYEKVAYVCPGGVLTTGYGHTNSSPTANIYPVYEGKVVTEEQAHQQLVEDLVYYENVVNGQIKGRCTQEMFDAMVSFTYNLGGGAFRDSLIDDYTNSGEYKKATDQMKLYVNANGKPLQGLINRRNDEVKLYESNLPSANKTIISQQIHEFKNEYGIHKFAYKTTYSDGSSLYLGKVIETTKATKDEAKNYPNATFNRHDKSYKYGIKVIKKSTCLNEDKTTSSMLVNDSYKCTKSYKITKDFLK